MRAQRLAMLEPSDSQECLDFMRAAYEISEKFDIPVLLRTTTRVAHSKSLVSFGTREERPVPRICATRAKHCRPGKRDDESPQARKEYTGAWGIRLHFPLNRMEMNGGKIGVVTASIAYQYAKDAFPEDTSFLKLGLTNPLPIELIRDFASKVDKLYVIEELDGFMESQILAAGIPARARPDRQAL